MNRVSSRVTVLSVVTVLTALALALGDLAGAPSGAVAAAPRTTLSPPAGLTATEVSFTGFGGLRLPGTVLQPVGAAGPRPGVVLVSGSGTGVKRERLLTEATEFARRGLAVLIYDKRSVGYSLSRRSYSELADDAVAGLRTLRTQPGVDPDRVGLWGLSEGGWVAPLAASRAPEARFVIVVGANAMTPARQQLWNETSRLRRRGVSGSLVDHAKLQFLRLGADARLFPEAYYDAPEVLRRVRQPLLGIWGTRDLLTPPQENPPLFTEALAAGGNTQVTLRFFEGADHAAHQSPDGGETRSPALAPGYADLVATWVDDVTSGRPPSLPPALATPPAQDHPSVPVERSAAWESADAQLAAVVLFVLAFTGYPAVAAARRIGSRRRNRRTRRPVTRWAPVLAGVGLVTVVGLFVYLAVLMAGRDPDPGPILAGRPLPWLLLQALALTAAVATVATARATAAAWRRPASGGTTDEGLPRTERARLVALLCAGTLLALWSVYWGLLLP